MFHLISFGEKNEYNMFKKKEKQLKQREERLRQSEELISLTVPVTSSTTLTNNNNNSNPQPGGLSRGSNVSKQRFEAFKAKYDQQLDTIREEIKQKMKENRRLYNAFKSIRDTNESLRLKVSSY